MMRSASDMTTSSVLRHTPRYALTCPKTTKNPTGSGGVLSNGRYALTDARAFCAAATSTFSAAVVSSQPRVFRPQSGLTHN